MNSPRLRANASVSVLSQPNPRRRCLLAWNQHPSIVFVVGKGQVDLHPSVIMSVPGQTCLLIIGNVVISVIVLTLVARPTRPSSHFPRAIRPLGAVVFPPSVHYPSQRLHSAPSLLCCHLIQLLNQPYCNL